MKDVLLFKATLYLITSDVVAVLACLLPHQIRHQIHLVWSGT